MPPAVVMVIGMHRSGTSLATAVLQKLGVALSDDLLEGNEFNERGYLESHRVMQLNDRVLAALGSSWRSPTTIEPFPDDWWNSEAVAPIRADLRDLVQRETERADGVWGVKDPRASRLLPLWNAVFDDLAIEPKYLLCVRHPAEVAASLNHRDGIERDLSDLLWLEHNLDALEFGEPRIAAVVQYSEWFEDSAALATRLKRALQLPGRISKSRAADIAELAASDLRHHHASTASPLPFVDDVYEALQHKSPRAVKRAIEPALAARRFAARAGTASRRADAGSGLSIYEITRRLAWREDVEEHDAESFLDASDLQARSVARVAVGRTSVRRALRDAVRAAATSDFHDPVTMNAVRALVPISDTDTSYLDVLKHAALKAIAASDARKATAAIDDLFRRSFVSGTREGRRSGAFSFLTDPEVLQACEAVARTFSAISGDAAAKTLAIVCTSPDAPDIGDRVQEHVRRGAAAGFDVIRIATEPTTAQGFWSPAAGPAYERLGALVAHMAASPIGATCFMPDAQDAAGRILSRICTSERQIFENRLVAEGRLYLPLQDELAAAQPLHRADMGVPEDAVLLCTIGRLEKCAQQSYLRTLSAILDMNRDVWLALSGTDRYALEPLIRASFEPNIRARVLIVGAAQWRAVLKASDIYCDTMPWSGCRGALAAGYLALPVVALAAVPEPPAAALIEEPAVLPRDEREYRNLADAYASDAELRARAGREAREQFERFGFTLPGP